MSDFEKTNPEKQLLQYLTPEDRRKIRNNYPSSGWHGHLKNLFRACGFDRTNTVKIEYIPARKVYGWQLMGGF